MVVGFVVSLSLQLRDLLLREWLLSFGGTSNLIVMGIVKHKFL